jgi:hypothetical protein
VKAQHQIARLEQLLERVRRNAAAPRVGVGPVTPVSDRVATAPSLEPMELSDDDLVAVLSDAPPEPDAATEPAVATATTLLGRQPPPPVAPGRAETGPRAPGASMPTDELPRVLTWPPERGEADPTLRPPPSGPAKPQPFSLAPVSDLPSESSWRPPAPDESAPERPSLADSSAAEEPSDADESSIEAPVLTPPPESGHQLSPESPRVWTTTPSQGPGKLELVEDEEEDLEAEGVPPSGSKVAESYSLPPGTEQFVQHIELEEALGEELELEELPEPPRASTTLASPASRPVGEDLAEPGVQEARVVAGLAVEVTQRPEVPSSAAPAQYTSVQQALTPRTFLELLDASLKLGLDR